MPRPRHTRFTVPITLSAFVVRQPVRPVCSKAPSVAAGRRDPGGSAFAAPGPVQGSRQTPRAAFCDSLVLVQDPEVLPPGVNLEACDVGLHELGIEDAAWSPM